MIDEIRHNSNTNGNSTNNLFGNIELSLKQYKKVLNQYETVIRGLEQTYNDKRYKNF
jgi:hypothetical protein